MLSRRTTQLDVRRWSNASSDRLRCPRVVLVFTSFSSPLEGPDMRALRYIRDNPVLVLTIAVAGLIAWVTADLLKSNERKPVIVETAGAPPLRNLPRPIAALSLEDPEVLHSPPVPVTVLPKLRLGMTRLEVEAIIGPPIPDRIQPVTVYNGRLTYMTGYELADPSPPMTIRPITPTSRQPRIEPQTFVALEYDATRPGHPLLAVLYPDPLF